MSFKPLTDDECNQARKISVDIARIAKDTKPSKVVFLTALAITVANFCRATNRGNPLKMLALFIELAQTTIKTTKGNDNEKKQ